MGRRKTIGDDEVLRRARDVFRAGGHAASTRDVARAAGISQAVLYQRFGSKAELFLRAMKPLPADVERLVGPYRPRHARADLRRLVGRISGHLAATLPTILHVLAHPNLGARRIAEWHQSLPFPAILATLADRFRRLKDDGCIGDVDPAAAAQVLLAAAHSFAVCGMLGQERRASVDTLVDILWTGFAPRGRGRGRQHRS